jgi:hypothetical protein
MVSLFISLCYLFLLTLNGLGMEDPVELLQLQDDGGLIISAAVTVSLVDIFWCLNLSSRMLLRLGFLL